MAQILVPRPGARRSRDPQSKSAINETGACESEDEDQDTLGRHANT